MPLALRIDLNPVSGTPSPIAATYLIPISHLPTCCYQKTA